MYTQTQWKGGLAMSVAVHAIVAAGLLIGFASSPAPEKSEPAAMAITMAAEPSAPPAPAQQVPDGPQQEETPPEPEVVKPVEKLPEAPVIPNVRADVVIPTKPKEQPSPEPVKPKPPVNQTTAPSAPPLPPKPTAGAPVQGTPSAGRTKAQQTWQGRVMAKLERSKRFPAAAQRAGDQDLVYVSITIDRSGRVLQSRLVTSKGIPALDAAALETVKRASPLPAPPESEEGERITFVVAINFFINGRR